MQTGAIVHLPSNRDLINNAARSVRTFSRNNLIELEQPSEPVASKTEPDPNSSTPCAGLRAEDRHYNLPSKALLIPSGKLLQRTLAPARSVTMPPDDLKRDEVSVLKSGDDESNLALSMERRSHGSCNALLMCDAVERPSTCHPMRGIGLRHGSGQHLHVDHTSLPENGTSGRATSETSTASKVMQYGSNGSYSMRRSATEPCES